MKNPVTYAREKYAEIRKYYAATGFTFAFELFVGMFFVVAVGTFLILSMLKLNLIVSSMAFLAVMSLSVTIPISIRNSRIDAIDAALPDALKHMALVLKAGGTVESALDEVAHADYGPLSADLLRSLHQLREGKTFDDVLLDCANNSGSTLFRRTATIVVDAKRAGAGVAQVMAEISEDARDVLRIKRERHSRTTMHVLFLSVSSVFLSPFIFGFTLSIVNYINVGIAGAMPGASQLNMCDLNVLLTMFLVLQTLIASFAIGIIREGKIARYILYVPLMVLACLLIYEAGKWLSLSIVGGKGLVC
ncbi:MAG: type II secretion system F family protein [Candidatus Micrarchaeota archaeon]